MVGARAGGRGQQQVLEVAGEDADRLVLRALAQLAEQIEHHRRGSSRARQAQRATSAQPAVAGSTAAGDAERGRDHRLDRGAPVSGSGPMSRVRTPSLAPRIIASARWLGACAQRSLWAK